MQHLVLSDSLFSVGLLNQNELDVFTLVMGTVQPSTYTDDPINGISGSVVFRLDQNRMLVQRIVYNVLDYLGDIGGLFGTFNGAAAAFSLILNFNGAYHLLTSSLFSVQTKIATGG